MDVWFGVSVLLSASVALSFTSPAQASQRLENHTSAGHVVEVYNRRSGENAAFRLLEVESGHEEDGPLLLKFTIKETLCLKTEKQNLQNCGFKDDGLVKSCFASYEQDPPVLVVLCDSVTMPPFRTKRCIPLSGWSNGNGRWSKKVKCEKGARCRNPVNPGGLAAISHFDDATPVLHPKRFRNRNITRNERRPIGKNCTRGIKCKKDELRVNTGVYSAIGNSKPASADEKPFRTKRSIRVSGWSKWKGRRSKKGKCGKGTRCGNPVNPGGLAAISHFDDATPVLRTKGFRNRNINGNERRAIGKNCTRGIKCKKEALRLNPGVYSAIENSNPASADEKPLRPKRSLNTNGTSNGKRRTRGPGGYSVVGKIPWHS